VVQTKGVVLVENLNGMGFGTMIQLNSVFSGIGLEIPTRY
jgi:hypothetical protein